MMHHTQIAQRVFNTPLMVDPAKALAFLTGLGPRITGREISVEGMAVDPEDQATATLPAQSCASLMCSPVVSAQTRNRPAASSGRAINLGQPVGVKAPVHRSGFHRNQAPLQEYLSTCSGRACTARPWGSPGTRTARR